MTQYYKVPGFTLANANLSTKVLVTLFLATVLGGTGIALLQYHERAGGFGERAAREWVLGNDEDPRAARIMPEKTFGELVAITHEHAFAVPILVFVVLHLVGLTSIREEVKIALYVLGFAAAATTLAAPWLVHYRGPAWTVLLRLSGLTLTLVLTSSTCLCLHELWLARPLRRWRQRPEPPAPNPMFPTLRTPEEER
jgi:hypothetical protein